MPEFSKYDQKDDCGGNPGVEFVDVDNFVAEDCDYPRCCCDNDDASVAWYIAVHSVEELGADYDVDCRPPYTGEDVEDGDWWMLVNCSAVWRTTVRLGVIIVSLAQKECGDLLNFTP